MRPAIKNVLIGCLVAVPALLASSAARGQAFLGGTPTAFTPQIGVVSTGTINDVQATVSADEKYVTLTMRPQSSTLLALRSFTFQQGNAAFGFVGMPETAANNGKSAAPARLTDRATPWPSARASVSILQRQGMTRVSKSPPSADTQPAGSGK